MTDLTDRVLANVTLPRARRRLEWRQWLKVGLPAVLIVVAVAQIGIGVAQLFLPLLGHAEHLGTTHTDPTAGFGHVERETAAFNIAIGVGLLWLALGPQRATGQLLPLLLSLVAVLALVTAFDLGGGDVGWVRLATHLPVLLATLIVLALHKTKPSPMDPDAGTADATSDTTDGGGGRIPGIPGDLGYRPHPQPPTAHRRSA